MRGALVILAVVLTAAFGATNASAQDLNCRNPQSPADFQVCSFPQLRELDDRLARRYFDVHRDLRGRDRQEFENDHLRFRRARRDCYDNIRCLEAVYYQRLEELREYRRRRW